MIESEYFLLTVFSLDCQGAFIINSQDPLYLGWLVNSLVFFYEGPDPYCNDKFLFLFIVFGLHLQKLSFMLKL